MSCRTASDSGAVGNSASALEQRLEAARGNGVGNTAGLCQHCFLGSLDEDHVHDREHFSGRWIVDRAAAVAWIGGGVELKDGKRAAREPPDGLRIEIAGARLRNRN